MELRDRSKKPNLPWYSNTPGTGYILMRDGVLSQYRQYGENRAPVFDIDYGRHDGVRTLHLHTYNGEDRSSDPIIIVDKTGKIINYKLYNKFKRIFKGVKIDG